MKTYLNYAEIPSNQIYLGSENGDGSIYEELDTFINEAIEPVRLLEDGIYHYFDIGGDL